jgi:hypothetical protein
VRKRANVFLCLEGQVGFFLSAGLVSILKDTADGTGRTIHVHIHSEDSVTVKDMNCISLRSSLPKLPQYIAALGKNLVKCSLYKRV